MTRAVTFSRTRKWTIAINVLIVSLLAPVLGLALLYLAFRPEFRQRLDLTPARAFSLSERTLKVLESLESDVDIYASFLPDDINPSGNFVFGLRGVIQTIARHTIDLLREYELRGRGRIRLHVYDPTSSAHFARLADLQRVLGRPAQNIVFVTDPQRRRTLELTDLAEFDYGADLGGTQKPARLHAFRDEESISAAILSVSEDEPIRIGVLSGHGEKRHDAGPVDAAGRAGLSSFVASLYAQNFDVAVMTADQLDQASPDILAILSPREPIPDPEAGAIVRFAENGGRLFVLLDPESSNSLDTPLLDRVYGIDRIPRVVCLETRVAQWTRDANQFETASYSQHAIVEPLKRKKLYTLWLNACALEGRQSAGLSIELLVFTPLEAWLNDALERGGQEKFVFDPASEKKSSYRLGYAVERKDGGRLVVLGDSDLLDNRSIALAAGNRDLGLNAFEWLAHRESLISIAPVPFKEARVDLNDEERSSVLLYVVGAIPSLGLLLALAVFWNRRK